MANFKNKASASACWLPIKKRLLAGAGSKKPAVNDNSKPADNSAGANNSEPENGATADDEASSPTSATSKKKGGRKPKSATENGKEGNAVVGKKRSRVPKDPNAPAAKRAKKGNKKEPVDGDGDGGDADGGVKIKPEEVNGYDHTLVKTEQGEEEGDMEYHELADAI